MKQFIAIAFVVIHLFPVGGSLAIRQYLVYKADKYCTDQTAKDRYNLNDLTEIKVPVLTAVAGEYAEYVRIHGHVEFENTSYNFVKMKVTRHAIYLMCIPNYETTRLFNTNVISVKNIKDIPIPKKNHIPFAKMNGLDNIKFSFVQFSFNSVAKHIRATITQPVRPVQKYALEIPEQPPKACC